MKNCQLSDLLVLVGLLCTISTTAARDRQRRVEYERPAPHLFFDEKTQSIVNADTFNAGEQAEQSRPGVYNMRRQCLEDGPSEIIDNRGPLAVPRESFESSGYAIDGGRVVVASGSSRSSGSRNHPTSSRSNHPTQHIDQSRFRDNRQIDQSRSRDNRQIDQSRFRDNRQIDQSRFPHNQASGSGPSAVPRDSFESSGYALDRGRVVVASGSSSSRNHRASSQSSHPTRVGYANAQPNQHYNQPRQSGQQPNQYSDTQPGQQTIQHSSEYYDQYDENSSYNPMLGFYSNPNDSNL